MFVSAATDELFDDARVVARLRAKHHHAGEARRFAKDGIGIFRISHVIVEAEPERRARAGRAARGGDALGIEVPVFGLGARKLDRASRVHVMSREFYFRGQSIIDRDHRDAVGQAAVEQIGLEGLFATTAKAAAVNEDQQRRRLIGLGLPDVHHIPLVRAVTDIGHVRGRLGFALLLGLRLAEDGFIHQPQYTGGYNGNGNKTQNGIHRKLLGLI